MHPGSSCQGDKETGQDCLVGLAMRLATVCTKPGSYGCYSLHLMGCGSVFGTGGFCHNRNRVCALPSPHNLFNLSASCLPLSPFFGRLSVLRICHGTLVMPCLYPDVQGECPADALMCILHALLCTVHTLPAPCCARCLSHPFPGPWLCHSEQIPSTLHQAPGW